MESGLDYGRLSTGVQLLIAFAASFAFFQGMASKFSLHQNTLKIPHSVFLFLALLDYFYIEPCVFVLLPFSEFKVCYSMCVIFSCVKRRYIISKM